MTLSEQEAKENLSKWGEFFDKSHRRLSVGHKRAFDYGFQAGLTYNKARVEELEAVMGELIRMADPHTNMSDIPLLDALSLAKATLGRKTTK